MSERLVRYKLEVNLAIVKEERWDTDTDDSWYRQTSDRLTVSESIALGAQDFLGVTHVLAALHDSITQIGDKAIKP